LSVTYSMTASFTARSHSITLSLGIVAITPDLLGLPSSFPPLSPLHTARDYTCRPQSSQQTEDSPRSAKASTEKSNEACVQAIHHESRIRKRRILHDMKARMPTLSTTLTLVCNCDSCWCPVCRLLEILMLRPASALLMRLR
jgi:hypothetical protein